MGCALIVHVFSFISVSYFDQNFVNWYMLLAIIATVASLRQAVPVPRATTSACAEAGNVVYGVGPAIIWLILRPFLI